MKQKMIRRSLLAVIGVVSMGVACSDDGMGLGPLITITNQWENEANPAHSFQFNDNTGGTPRREGTFDGDENPPGTAVSNDVVNGSWATNGRIQFTVQRPTGNVTYQGTLTSNLNRMSLSSTAGPLVLLRQ
jgi:hypothetical protein